METAAMPWSIHLRLASARLAARAMVHVDQKKKPMMASMAGMPRSAENWI